MRLPVIVGMGGVNAAGRTSDFQSFRRMVIDDLPNQERQRTLVGLLADEPGLEDWTIYVDDNQNGRRDAGENLDRQLTRCFEVTRVLHDGDQRGDHGLGVTGREHVREVLHGDLEALDVGDLTLTEAASMVIGGSGLDSPGYDLLALMTGSEGMLGIIVEVAVKLLPKPERAQVLLAAFDDVVKAGEAVGNIIAAGIIPGGLEMMDRLAIKAAEDFVHAGYPLEAEAILLCELDGTNEEVSEHVYKVREVLRQSGASEVRTAKDEAERSIFWNQPKDRGFANWFIHPARRYSVRPAHRM